MPTIALLGTGRWGENIRNVLEEKSVDVVVSNDQSATDKLLDRVIKKGDIDGIIIATPPVTHIELALKFSVFGKPIYIEKPVGMDVEQLQALDILAKKKNTEILSGHIHLYNPAFRKAKSIIKESKSGKLMFMHLEGMNNGPYRDDVSALWDWGPHDISMTLDLLQTLPESVQGWGVRALRPATNLYDACYIKLSYKPELAVVINVSWLMPEKRKKLTAICENVGIIYDDCAERKVIIHNQMRTLNKNNSLEANNADVSYPDYDLTTPLELEIDDFLHVVSDGTKPYSSLDMGISVATVLSAIERSIESDGEVVRLSK